MSARLGLQLGSQNQKTFQTPKYPFSQMIEQTANQNNGYLEIANFYVQLWSKSEENRLRMIQFIKSYSSVQSVLCVCYSILVHRKELDPIEKLNVDLLDDLESEAKSWKPELTGKDLDKLMKSIWVMNYLLTLLENKIN